MVKLINIFYAILLTLFMLPVHALSQPRQFTSKEWSSDLELIVSCLKKKHPDLYYRISEREFENRVHRARNEIKSAAGDDACAVAIMKVIASIQDGHTKWLPDGKYTLNSWFPVRMFLFDDGIYITAIDEVHARWVASKVLRVGKFQAQEAWKKAASLVPADNNFMKRNRAAIYLANSKVVFGLGISKTPDQLELEIETPSGGIELLRLHSFESKFDTGWFKEQGVGPGNRRYVNAFTHTRMKPPLHLKHAGHAYKNYWFEHLEKERALYMQMNRVYEGEEESFEDFRRRMWNHYDAHADSIDRFILDIRYNNGGMGLMLLPFLNDMIKRDEVNKRGRLFVLVGRGTYSAAVFLMSMMFLHTEATFVGEPPACAFNMFSDALIYTYRPNYSGSSIQIATVHFHLNWPDSKDYIFPPHCPVACSSNDYFKGEDPVLARALSGKAKIIEHMIGEEGPQAALDYFKENNIFDWGVNPWYTPGHDGYHETRFNEKGYQLLNAEKVDDAIALLELNTLLYPDSANTWDSLGEAHFRKGNFEKSAQNYEKSLQLDPKNDNAVKMLKKLKETGQDMG